MLIILYLFTLIVGAVLLGASILLGGHGDLDADADVGVDLDADLDADVDADVDGLDHGEVGGHGDVSGFLLTFVSFRFWTFFLAFFGMTGLVLDLLGLVENEWITLALALVMGFGTGTGAMAAIRKLGADTSGEAIESSDYVGKTARVLVPFEGSRVGKVRVSLKGSQIDLLASSVEDDDSFAGREEVLIVEMDGLHAKVAAVDATPT
jgi:membrane protein implicated in regulation of membrane protease activity